MGLNQAVLHLLLQTLKAGLLALVNTLVSCLHLARPKLTDGCNMVVRVFQALIHVGQVLLRRESCCALHPSGGAHRTVFRGGSQSLAVVIFRLETLLVVDESNLLGLLAMLVNLSRSHDLIHNGLVETSKFARYLATCSPRHQLWRLQILL